MEKIISNFLHIAILKIDEKDKIIETIINSNPEFKISNIKNIYDIFAEEDRFRLQRVLESGLDIGKKYMQLNKSTKLTEYVDVKLHEEGTDRYVYLQFFQSNRDREVEYDRYLEKLKKLSEKDPLTKIYNRKGFEEKISRIVKTSDPKKRLGLIYLDMDNLKPINDTHGHKMGDKAILNVVDILSSTLRERDIMARLGGDEFIIVVEEITGKKSTTYGLAKRLLKLVSGDKNKKYSTTLSVGVHIVEVGKISKHINNPNKFLMDWNKEVSKTDKAMYQSKKNGRNQITVTKGFRKYYSL
jgi:diguanylate cyclase (GGDEF)-like protein